MSTGERNSIPEHGGLRDLNNGFSDKNYSLTGKIMLSAIVILLFVVALMVALHLYARWYLVRARSRRIRRSRNRRNHLVFYVDPTDNPNTNIHVSAARGLEADVLKSLPVFVYSSDSHPDPIDCAVCLSEFEEKETGRTLPKCNHSFHIGCIDMWFHSHSTCPLCRSPVEPPPPENPIHIVSSSEITESCSSSGLCATCLHEGASTSSFEGRRKKPVELMGVTIEVPRRNGNLEDESATESPAAGQGFRSPMSRMLSFKRILSREKRPSCSGSVTEVDIEQGRDEIR